MERKKNRLIFLLSLFLYFIHFFVALGSFKRSIVYTTGLKRSLKTYLQMRLFQALFQPLCRKTSFILLQNWLLLGFLLLLQSYYLALIQVNLVVVLFAQQRTKPSSLSDVWPLRNLKFLLKQKQQPFMVSFLGAGPGK